jgi:murein DD-endopeptidase MepM/ murein hydrolase activator NlpD
MGFIAGFQTPKTRMGWRSPSAADFGYEGETLYTVCAHLATSDVWRGQTVEDGQVLGTVGETGHTSGPHLHFEVRVGENYYFSTRNPELWMVPPEGWGVLAGRVLDNNGHPLAEQAVKVTSVDTGREWEVWTYALDTVPSTVTTKTSFWAISLRALIKWTSTSSAKGRQAGCSSSPARRTFLSSGGTAVFGSNHLQLLPPTSRAEGFRPS